MPYAAPGDIVNVQITGNRSDYMEGVIDSVLHYSPLRTTPFCSHFGICGGCKWQHIDYQKQLIHKQQQVYDQLSRIGKLKNINISPIIGASNDKFYRNKLEYTFSSRRWRTSEEMHLKEPVKAHEALGFHIPGLFDKVLDIDTCYLQPNPSNEMRLAVKNYAIENGLSFYDIREHTGFLRTMIIRNSVSSGEWMVIVVFGYDDQPQREALLNFLTAQFPQITSLCYVVNKKHNDTINDLEVVSYAGRPYMEETMDGLVFKISPKSFFQTNSLQAQRLYNVVRDFAGLQPSDIVYDLYTGTGTIALYLAKLCQKVVGVEYVPEAIEDAKENALLNDIHNTVFYAGDMKNLLLPAFFAENGQPDVMVLDPPRAGIHPDVAGNILSCGVKRIVYVSCNPATQARDMAWLSSAYQILKVQPVDMFPHTHHVENVILAEKITV